MTPRYWRKRESWLQKHEDLAIIGAFFLFLLLSLGLILYLANRP